MEQGNASGVASVSLLFLAIFGPVYGAHAAVLCAALAGALWPLSNRDTTARGAGVLFVLRLVLTAFILTSIIASLVEAQWGWTPGTAVLPVAFLIAAIGDKWIAIFESLVDRVRGRISNNKSGGQHNE